MPLVKATLTIPANTAQNAAIHADIAPSERFTERFGILFPLNSAGLVGVQLRNRETLIAPGPGGIDEWIHDDGHLVEWDDEIDLGTSPRVLRIYAYNEDDSHDRTVEVRVVVSHITLRQLLAGLTRSN